MKLIKHNALALAIAVTLSAGLVGCEKQDDVPDERYTGVPHNGQSCKEFYKLPANQSKCTQQDGRGGR